MITVQCLLEFETKKDKQKALNLMRNFSACIRYAYNRLLEGWNRKDLKKHLQSVFPLNSRYCDDAILKARETLNACIERKQNPKKLIFGTRHLFEKLKKRHITGKRRKELIKEWKEKRQGTVYSRGDKTKKGNLNIRFVFLEKTLYLRINTGKGRYVYTKVHRNVQKGRAQKDKWVNFVESLAIGESTKKYIPYSVELKKRSGKIYAFVSFNEELPEVSITKESGIIGIDVNASPFHIAYAEVKRDGNLRAYGKINLSNFIGKSKETRELLSWQVAHQIVNLARERKRAIAIENLKKLPKGKKGDGRRKLRRRLQQFIYKGLLQKIEILARREGIEVVKVNPAFTSVIGQLKYSPQYGIDKDVAGAFVIGRRGMGFKEEIPENYLKLLSKKEILEYSLYMLKEKKRELKERLEKENNNWKKNAIKTELRTINIEIKMANKQLKDIQSPESNPATRQQASGGNKPVRGLLDKRQKSWKVLRAVLTFPILGKSFVRDFSPLKTVLVSGDWKRVVRRSVPVPGAGTTAQYANVQFW